MHLIISIPIPQMLLFIGKYVCEICGAMFKTENTLQGHRLTHGERTNQCPDCPATFKRKTTLKTHRQIHQNVKYKCNQCSVVFAAKSTLLRHISE